MKPSIHAREVFSTYPDYYLHHLRPHNCIHGVVIPELVDIIGRSDGMLKIRHLGQSLEGRSIHLVSCGTGRTTVLLWSQMHGDEPTATLALMDMVHFFATDGRKKRWVREMLEELTIHILPMLNPDGAEVARRHTASWVDMNRDARALVTKEARLLRDLQSELRPQFGFNLHDQELSSVGETAVPTAIALLAPAMDVERSVSRVRLRAIRVAAFLAHSLASFSSGRVARYSDAYEPRAFGDNMQAWGTSTVLIESGHWPGDREKMFVRKLNYVAFLTGLRAIGNGAYQDVDLDHYKDLPENGKRVYDIIIRDVIIDTGRGERFPGDIALQIKPPFGRLATDPQVVVKEIGDMGKLGSLETIDGGKRVLQTASISVDSTFPLSRLLDMMQVYYPLS